ncbi:putative valacyclovir hydrolase [Coniella lustricola]|uniref:Putative valacyclovir hydrolase n=1 Tax=Coniella lustricola TaxID=2025994 RepID=A0A2T2ZY46_9PEZI|nr:putative valacyclovir hydrolase [Coniella lustricola]
MTHQTLTLPDGRTLEYVVSGANDKHANDDFALLYFHGTVGSSLPYVQTSDACRQAGIKLITPSRPGYGGSTRHKGRRVVDVVADMEALLAELKVRSCVAVGHSGGGPHAMACAAKLQACVAAVVIAGAVPVDAEGLDYAAGQGETNVEEWLAMQQGEPAVRAYCTQEATSMLAADARTLTDALASLLPAIDKDALRANNCSMGQHLVDQIQDGLRDGQIDGWVDDDLELMQEWGFDLTTEVKVPTHVYQGSEDRMVPLAHGEWLAGHLPAGLVNKRVVHGQGHISILGLAMDEVLALAGALKRSEEGLV